MRKSLLVSILLISFLGVQAQDVVPTQDGDKYSLTTGDLFFEVDASNGGQVSSFAVSGSELLYYGGGDNQGSTFWPSPQDPWGWPPSTQLDNDDYATEITNNSIVMQGEKDPASQLSFKKTFTANSTEKSILLEYEILNTRESGSYSVAGWEVTRVPTAGGLSFFPKGDGEVSGNFADYTEESGGIVWYDADNSDPGGRKFFCDGSEGWLAHVNKDGYLFVKTFDDVPEGDMAPGEAEVEFWHASPGSYVELENQSEYVSIPAGGTLTYTVKWTAKKLSDEIDATEGSTELVGYVRNIYDPTASREHKVLQDHTFYVGPNPVRDQLIIRSSQTVDIDFTIYDITGKEMMRHSKLSSGTTLDISELNSGIYLYSVKSGNKLESGKLIVK